MSKKTVKKHQYRNVVILTILFAVLCVASIVGGKMIADYRAGLLQAMQEEVDAINAERDQEYAVALSEFESSNTTGGNLAWPTQKMEGWDVVDLTNYPLENPRAVTVSRQEAMYNGMLLVNQWHSRPDDFDENVMVSVGTYTKGNVGVADYNVKLHPNAINAFQNCFEAAKQEGYDYYIISEGYRTWEEQNERFQKKLTSLAAKYSGDALIEQARKEVNYPGTSEFNSGVSGTIRLYKRNDAEVNALDYTTCDAGVWMTENSWRYGLVFRFPLTDYPMKGVADKSYKTGISIKLRMLRYVGKGNAAVMNTLDLCLEEYIEYLMEHPHIAVFEDGKLKYEIQRQQVGDAETFTVDVTSKCRNYSSSLDNMGGVITVFEY